MEEIVTYGVKSYIQYNDTQDKYTYVKNNNVIYGINGLEKRAYCNYLYGVCFESTSVPAYEYFPLNMYEEEYPTLKEKDLKSAMLFKIGTEEEGIHHSLQIYKGKDTTRVMYHSKRYHDDVKDYYEEVIADEKYSLPNLSDNTISSEEIQNILLSLQERLEGNIVLDIISTELNTFDKKINIRKGLVQEELAPLSPKLFMDKSLDEISTLVSANKEDYFNVMKNQFELATNIDKSSEIPENRKIKSIYS